jgi:hypothetical protein
MPFLVFDSLVAYYLSFVLSDFAVNFCFGHATVWTRVKGVLLTLESNRDLIWLRTYVRAPLLLLDLPCSLLQSRTAKSQTTKLEVYSFLLISQPA